MLSLRYGRYFWLPVRSIAQLSFAYAPAPSEGLARVEHDQIVVGRSVVERVRADGEQLRGGLLAEERRQDLDEPDLAPAGGYIPE